MAQGSVVSAASPTYVLPLNRKAGAGPKGDPLQLRLYSRLCKYSYPLYFNPYHSDKIASYAASIPLA